MNNLDIIGKKFGRLTILGISLLKTRDGRKMADCVCECGMKKGISIKEIKSGNTRSCGCLHREVNRINYQLKFKKHGCSHNNKTPEYEAWCQMKKRCYNEKHKAYKNYGGRGITVCEKWRNDFVSFLNDMGKRPYGLSLDRINNNGNYEPTNCKWSNSYEQTHNRRCSK